MGALGWGDRIKQFADFLPESIDGAAGGLFEQRLELGEELFDGVEVGGVSRQQAQGGASGFDSLLDAGHFMTGQVVGTNDVARLQRRAQALAHISEEGLAIHGSVQHQRRGNGVDAQTGNEGGGFPMPLRHRGDTALTFGCTPTCAGHGGVGPGFIQEYQLGHIQRGLAGAPFLPCGLHVGARLLAGVQSFF